MNKWSLVSTSCRQSIHFPAIEIPQESNLSLVGSLRNSHSSYQVMLRNIKLEPDKSMQFSLQLLMPHFIPDIGSRVASIKSNPDSRPLFYPSIVRINKQPLLAEAVLSSSNDTLEE
ncbi:Uncharacterized protein TCM_035649 [Theobroma cacao]|uniref:Uncharacterized protein n=1 Tax=Theobroma cacao TaxID=3641 RepID=A0A061FI90_THECC|nr:Uncharacterized protein TCM_035649 [Theobroma cacao]